MNIQPISQNFNQPVKKNTSFKSAYPVVHWVAEANGSYAPVASLQLTKKLQNILVRLLNATSVKTPERKELAIRAQKFLRSRDRDFDSNHIARTFHDVNGGWGKNVFHPIAYMLTGKDALLFEDRFGKPLGMLKKESAEIWERGNSAELNIARADYAKGGLNYVKKRSKEFCDSNKIQHQLHTKFEVKRNKSGEVVGYNLIGLGFYPARGENNPLEKLGYVAPSK